MKKRKPTRKGLVRILDKTMSCLIKKRDIYCVICGTFENLTNGHVFSRVAYSTRWDFDNCFCQCVGCNLRHEYDPYPLMEYARKILGSKKLELLHKKHRTVKKYKTYELAELLETLKKGVGLWISSKKNTGMR